MMNNRQPIKRANGSVRGYIVESGDRKTAQSAGGAILGWYLKSQNKTFDTHGKTVGFGEQLSLLMED